MPIRSLSLALAALLVSACSVSTAVDAGESEPNCADVGTQIADAVAAAEGPCVVDADCTVAQTGVSCLQGCSVAVSAANAGVLAMKIFAVDQQSCTLAGDCGSTACDFDPSIQVTAFCKAGSCALAAGESVGGISTFYFHAPGLPGALDVRLEPDDSYQAVYFDCRGQAAFSGTWMGENVDEFELLGDDGNLNATLSLDDGGNLRSDTPLFLADAGITVLDVGANCAVCDGGALVDTVACPVPFGF